MRNTAVLVASVDMDGRAKERLKTFVDTDLADSHCLRAACDIQPSELILYMEGVLGDRPDRHTLQVGVDLHLGPVVPLQDLAGTHLYPWIYTNHSCQPNARVRNRELLAIREIACGDEITFDYDTTEFEMASPFVCHCEHAACRGSIRGYRFLNAIQRERLSHLVNDHLIHLADLEQFAVETVD